MQIPYRDFQYLHTEIKTDSINTDNQPRMMRRKLKTRIPLKGSECLK